MPAVRGAGTGVQREPCVGDARPAARVRADRKRTVHGRVDIQQIGGIARKRSSQTGVLELPQR